MVCRVAGGTMARLARERRQRPAAVWGCGVSGVAFLGCALQSIKRAARGFRNLGYFETMVFLRLGGLDFSAQTSRLCATH